MSDTPSYAHLASFHPEGTQDQPIRFVMGPLPPPFAGVSVFVMRRCGELRRANAPYEVVDWPLMSYVQRVLWLLKILFHPRSAIYEFHGVETTPSIFVRLRPFKKHVVYWVHSGQFMDSMPAYRRFFFEPFLRRVDECYLVSKHIYGFFEQNKMPLPANNTVQNAFLPPILEEEDRIWASYDADTLAFIENHQPLMSVQGSNAFYLDVDRYGVDVAVDMVGKVKEVMPNVGLLIGRSASEDPKFVAYQDELHRRIRAYGIEENVHFLMGNREMWPITKRSDVFLRPSNQDGDSVAVREALYFDVPVFASDACWRPDACILFKNRDADDLADKVKAWWEKRGG